MPRSRKGLKPLTLQELAALLRSGEVQDGPLADFAAEYRTASEVFRKKDD